MTHQTSCADRLKLAQQRVAAVYDPELLQNAGLRFVERMQGHFSQVQNSESKVLNWDHPDSNLPAARQFVDSAPLVALSKNGEDHFADISIAGSDEESPSVTSAEMADAAAQLVEEMLTRGQNLHDPRYVGHQVPPPIPLAALFDSISLMTNQVMAIYEMAPWAMSVEQAVVDVLGEKIGFTPQKFSGFITHGGSLANLTALLTARNVLLADAWQTGMGSQQKQPVLLAHADMHYSISRSAGILGIGTDNILSIAVDDRRCMDVAALETQLLKGQAEGRPVIAVCACAGSTLTGAFDPLDQIADVCEKHHVWLHVDAAHGGAACFSPRHQHLVEGLHRADSVVVDAHKMMFTPALCAFVFYRDRAHRFEAFQQNAPYLYDPAAPEFAEYDVGRRTLECTKRAAAFGLWGVWSMFGDQLFADLVDVTFDVARTFYEKLCAADDFDAINEPQSNILVFRYIPAELQNCSSEEIGHFQWRLRRDLIQSGEFYIVPSQYEGSGALRATVMNPLTRSAHIDQLLETLRRRGAKLIADRM